METRFVDQKRTKQVLIDRKLHFYLKLWAARNHDTIRSLIEDAVLNYYDIGEIQKLVKEEVADGK